MTDAHHFAEIERLLREAPTLKAGIDGMYALVRRHIPESCPLWKVLTALKWRDDVDAAGSAWDARLTTCVPAGANGVYLGIDGLNMPDGKGIELGCSSRYEPGRRTIDYIYDCDVYCDELPMPALADYYTWLHRQGGMDELQAYDFLHVEYPVALGASALVLREVFRRSDPAALAGAAGERCFAYGFHDGDILRIGTATSAGFDCDATFDCWR